MLKLYTPHRSEHDLVGGAGAVAKLREILPQLPRHVQAALLAEPEEEEHAFADADDANSGGDDARVEQDAHAFGSDDMAWDADQQHSAREPAPASATATTSSAGVCMITSAERREWESYIDSQAKLARDMRREQREQFTAAEASNVTGNASEYARISAFTRAQTERRDALLEGLGDKQREVRDALYRAFTADSTDDQVLLMVAGEAGTGKSRVIDVIVLDALLQFGGAGQYGPVLVVAKTNAAAHLVGGQTVHKTFGMHKLNGHENALSRLYTELRNRFRPVKAVILEEKSLASLEDLGHILALWRFAFPEIDAPFAGRHFVLIGDFYQLPTISGTPLYQKPKSRASPATHEAWQLLTERFTFIELTENFRFKADPQWAQLLRYVKMCEAPPAQLIAALNTRVRTNWEQVARESTSTTLWSAPVWRIVNQLNALFLRHREVLNIWATHAPNVAAAQRNLGGSNTRYALYSHKPDGRQWHVPLEPCLQLARAAKVRLTRTLSLELGLVNGATGVMHSFAYDQSPGSDLIMPSATRRDAATKHIQQPIALVQFDARYYSGLGVVPGVPRVVPIFPVDEDISFAGGGWKRRQLPLILAQATTVHSCQGMTCTTHVTHPPLLPKDTRRALLYTALSRVTTMLGLTLLAKVTAEHFTCGVKHIATITAFYDRLRNRGGAST